MLTNTDNYIANQLLLTGELFKHLRNTSYTKYVTRLHEINNLIIEEFKKNESPKVKLNKIRKLIDEEIEILYNQFQDDVIYEANKLSNTELLLITSLFASFGKDINFKHNTIKKDSIVIGGDVVESIPTRNKNDHKDKLKQVMTLAIVNAEDVEHVEDNVKAVGKKKKGFIKRGVKNIVNSARNGVRSGYYYGLEKAGINKGYIYEAKLESCPLCKPNHGLSWKKWGDIPYDKRPLIHYNCLCVIHPVTTNYRTNEFNELNSDEWLALQTKEVQNIINSSEEISLTKLKEIIGV